MAQRSIFMRATCKNNKKEIGGLRLIWLGRIFKEPKKQLKRMGNYSLIGRFVVCRRLGCELEEVFLLENTFVWGDQVLLVENHV